MSITGDKLTAGEWHPDIYKNRDFKAVLEVAINGVVGYDASDTFEGFVTTEAGATTGDTYTIALTDPGNGLITVTMPKATTAGLDIGTSVKKALFHNIDWTRTSDSRRIPLIVGRPIIHARAKA